MSKQNGKPGTDWEVIHTYTRAQALADGVLIDVTETAREAGILHPTALTAAAWAECVCVPEGVDDQDEVGRLRDLLWMLRLEARRRRDGASETHFELWVRNNGWAHDLVRLKAVCGPGDELEPVITVMLPDED
jgi:hypothetical protein